MGSTSIIASLTHWLCPQQPYDEDRPTVQYCPVFGSSLYLLERDGGHDCGHAISSLLGEVVCRAGGAPPTQRTMVANRLRQLAGLDGRAWWPRRWCSSALARSRAGSLGLYVEALLVDDFYCCSSGCGSGSGSSSCDDDDDELDTEADRGRNLENSGNASGC